MLTKTGQLRSKFDGIAAECAIANSHFYIFRKIFSASTGEFQSEMYQSLDFWGSTMRAHVRTALLHLCHVYDTHRDAFHLLRLVEDVPDKELPPAAQQLRQADLDFLQKEHAKENKYPDPSVAKLRKWRDKLIAHSDKSLPLDGRQDFLKQYPVDLNEIQSLIDTAFSILERCATY